ncbi:hypothetical protein A8713_07335 [Streptomyces sp. SAT1]|nr:hypothetical protein A8713_07335 [Streptomyces sp. SAT1]
MRRDGPCASGRATGKQPPYLRRERLREPYVLRRPPPRVPGPAPPPRLGVGQTPLFGAGEGRLLDEDALPFVPAAAPGEPHHRDRQRALLP